VPSRQRVQIERGLLVGVRLAERRNDLRLALDRVDRFQPQLGDALLATRLPDRRIRAFAPQERACALSVPGTPLVAADPARAGSEERLSHGVERFSWDEHDELAIHGLGSLIAGNPAPVPTLHVQPRPTPEERADQPVEVEVDEALTVLAAAIEDWVANRPAWEFTLREGHDFGKANNVEGELLFVAGEQSSSLRFRLDQLDRADELDSYEFLLIFSERDGIAQTARLTENGLDVELFHILTFS
jgi:hypothetical protein